jgi:hypothetical protein
VCVYTTAPPQQHTTTKTCHCCGRIEVFMAVTMKNAVFWDIHICGKSKMSRMYCTVCDVFRNIVLWSGEFSALGRNALYSIGSQPRFEDITPPSSGLKNNSSKKAVLSSQQVKLCLRCSSALKMAVTCSCETSDDSHRTAGHYAPQESVPVLRCRIWKYVEMRYRRGVAWWYAYMEG